MRLWSLHPRYLDTQGLLACWREALLAKAVLSGQTSGYRHHPQLERFRSHPSPRRAINRYLAGQYLEARRRSFAFDGRKVGRLSTGVRIPVTSGQARYEMFHLKRKLWKRDRRTFFVLHLITTPALHPLFRMVDGGVETWEHIPEKNHGTQRSR